VKRIVRLGLTSTCCTKPGPVAKQRVADWQDLKEESGGKESKTGKGELPGALSITVETDCPPPVSDPSSFVGQQRGGGEGKCANGE